MKDRSAAEGCLVWMLILASIVALVFGGSAFRAQIAQYWDYLFIYLCMGAGLWLVVWVLNGFSEWDIKRQKKKEEERQRREHDRS